MSTPMRLSHDGVDEQVEGVPKRDRDRCLKDLHSAAS